MHCSGFKAFPRETPPHIYIIEFKRKEVEELLLMPLDGESLEYFGQQVWDILVAEYERHNKGVDK